MIDTENGFVNGIDLMGGLLNGFGGAGNNGEVDLAPLTADSLDL